MHRRRRSDILKFHSGRRAADLIKHVSALTQPDLQIDKAEAWGLALKAVQRYGARRESEGLASLPEHVRRVVKFFGWRELCLSTSSIDIVRGEFLKMYDSHSARRQEQTALPPVSEKILALLGKSVKALNN